MQDLLYGRNAVLEALRAGRRSLQRLLLADNIKENEGLRTLQELAISRRIKIQRLPRHELDKRLDGANHQGVALESGGYRYADLDAVLAAAKQANEPPLILILDHLQDPQNVGTLLRTAEVVGAHGVIIPDRRAASITPAVVNASSGAVEHLNIVTVANLVQTIEALKEANVWVAGLEEDPRAQPFDKVDLNIPLAIVVGAEGPGLARLVRERCDYLIELPMRGNVASLNAAVAGSIILYHAWRARH